jgi:hypothetical protein
MVVATAIDIFVYPFTPGIAHMVNAWPKDQIHNKEAPSTEMVVSSNILSTFFAIYLFFVVLGTWLSAKNDAI